MTMRRQIVIMLLGLMTTLSLPAFAIAGSRESDHATQPYKYIGKELDRTHGLDWLHKGGVTTREDFLVNNKEVISEFNIYITGNSNETLIGKNGKKIEDGPELILGHEFFAHVFPVLFGSITGNGIKNEIILRRELGKEERKEDEHPE